VYPIDLLPPCKMHQIRLVTLFSNIIVDLALAVLLLSLAAKFEVRDINRADNNTHFFNLPCPHRYSFPQPEAFAFSKYSSIPSSHPLPCRLADSPHVPLYSPPFLFFFLSIFETLDLYRPTSGSPIFLFVSILSSPPPHSPSSAISGEASACFRKLMLFFFSPRGLFFLGFFPVSWVRTSRSFSHLPGTVHRRIFIFTSDGLPLSAVFIPCDPRLVRILRPSLPSGRCHLPPFHRKIPPLSRAPYFVNTSYFPTPLTVFFF